MQIGLSSIRIGARSGTTSPPQITEADVLAAAFPSGEDGVWIDFFDAETLFQDTSATTAVTTNGDRIARANDKSPNGNNATQGTADNRLTYVTGGSNGKPGADSVTSGRRVNTPAFFDTTFDAAISVYALVSPESVGSGTQIFLSASGARLYVGIDSAGNVLVNTSLLSDTQVTAAMPSPATAYLVSFRYDGTTKKVAVYGPSSQRFTNEAATGNIGLNTLALAIGDLSTGGFTWQGTGFGALVVNKAASDADDEIICGYFRERLALNFSRVPKVVCDGNSITFGTGSADPTSDSYPAQMAALLPGWEIENLGVPSATTAQRNTNAPVQIDYKFGSNRAKHIAVLWEVTNDLYFEEPASATDAINRYVAWCQDRRTAGYQVVAVTVLPRTQSGLYANFETHRQDVNTYIRANWATFADALADVAADTTIGDAGDELNTTYYADGIHPTRAGYGIIAPIIADAILSL